MNNVNNIQVSAPQHLDSYICFVCVCSNLRVQSTNDASTVSKSSAVSKGYFKDDFIEFFVEKKRTRASLIHLGYYTRAVILFKLVTEYIEFLKRQQILKFQIISCGSGFDTTYWKLSDLNLLSKNSLFIEIDFPSVIKKKISLISESNKLKSYTNGSCNIQKFPGINQLNCNHYLLEGDLSDIDLIEKLLKNVDIDYDVPTLFLSECVITYMKEHDSDQLIKWMASKFSNSCFINYEQIHPEDGFGEIMLRHFDKLQSSLYSVSKYPNCKAHYFRYKNLGFESSYAISEWDALIWLTTEEERKNALSLELFDEYEELHLKCVHYVVAIAGNKIALDWIKSFPVHGNGFIEDKRIPFKLDCINQSFELYRHASCCSKELIYLFGGCSKQNRSSKVHKVDRRDPLSIQIVESAVSKNDTNVRLDMVYGCATHFEIDKVPYICLYGGRTSPEKICNDGSIVILQVVDNKLMVKSVISERNPVPRYRASMVTLNRNDGEVDCWLFGGRTADLSNPLSDLWQLSLHHDDDRNIIYRWTPHERKLEDWPSGRMSHSCVACPKRCALFLTGGLRADSSTVLDDVWKWCCGSQTWQKLELSGRLLPRYGHTSHVINDDLFLVGGVNTLAGMQPNLAVIDLNNMSVMEFVLQVSVVEPVLFFNHTSYTIKDGEDAQILVIGGGGNCFSFGTYLNRNIQSVRLNQIRTSSS